MFLKATVKLTKRLQHLPIPMLKIKFYPKFVLDCVNNKLHSFKMKMYIKQINREPIKILSSA